MTSSRPYMELCTAAARSKGVRWLACVAALCAHVLMGSGFNYRLLFKEEGKGIFLMCEISAWAVTALRERQQGEER